MGRDLHGHALKPLNPEPQNRKPKTPKPLSPKTLNPKTPKPLNPKPQIPKNSSSGLRKQQPAEGAEVQASADAWPLQLGIGGVGFFGAYIGAFFFLGGGSDFFGFGFFYNAYMC